MLALDPVRIKSSKRKLRVERCNTAKATAATQAKLKAEERASALEARKAASKAKSALLSKSKDRQLSRAASGKSSSILSALPPPPRPDIGASLKELPKEDRKALKVGDEERQARRLAKKQRGRAELKMEKAKEILDKKLKAANRGGKSAAESKRSRGGAAGTAKKTRVRSDKMAGKKNSKKPEV
jgi:nucleolar protein 12